MPFVRLALTLQGSSAVLSPSVTWHVVGAAGADAAIAAFDGSAVRARPAGASRPFSGYRGGRLSWKLVDNGLLPRNVAISGVTFNAQIESGTISGGAGHPQGAFVDGIYLVTSKLKASAGGYKNAFVGGVAPAVTLATDPHTGAAWEYDDLFRRVFSIGGQYIDNGNQDWIDDSYLDINEAYALVSYVDLSADDERGDGGRGWGAGGWGWGPPSSESTGEGGGPGTINDCECCMAFKLEVINKALGHLGITQVVQDLEEETREMQTADVYYEDDLAATLRSFPWGFATKYLALTLLDGEAGDPINEDWTFMYRYPVDCLMARRLVRDGTGRSFDADPPPFREGRGEIAEDEQGKVLYSNFEDAILEYTSGESGVECLGDSLFKEAVSWRLAWHMAPGLGRDKKQADACYAMHVRTLKIAEAYAANEQQQEQNVDGEASWIRNR